jgi:hypothetical protein
MGNKPFQFSDETKIIITCENCHQNIRIPLRHNKIVVTCPTCECEFEYQYYALGLSSSSRKPIIIGFTGGLLGFLFIEIAHIFLSWGNHLFGTVLTMGIYGICLGITMESAEGILENDRKLLFSGLRDGSIFGLLSGSLTGLIAQLIFSAILAHFSLNPSYAFIWYDPALILPPVEKISFARTVSWMVLGLLSGLSYGAKEKTRLAIKQGAIFGTVVGLISGLFFEPLSITLPTQTGVIGRLFGFVTLGMAIGLAFFQFKKARIRPYRKIYIPLDKGSDFLSYPDPVVLACLGIVLIIAGGVIAMDNLSGLRPTFPFAGFITSSIGVVLLKEAFKH